MELNAGIKAPVFSQNRRQTGEHCRTNEADFKHADFAARDTANGFQIFIDFVQCAAGAIDQSFSRGRQLHGARSAEKQGTSNLFFETANLLRERRLGEMEALAVSARVCSVEEMAPPVIPLAIYAWAHVTLLVPPDRGGDLLAAGQCLRRPFHRRRANRRGQPARPVLHAGARAAA